VGMRMRVGRYKRGAGSRSSWRELNLSHKLDNDRGGNKGVNWRYRGVEMSSGGGEMGLD